MIVKQNYRDQVRDILLKRMKTGVLKAGDSISLAQLSRELEISVTPIREALSQLELANIIKALPNRGFIIPVMDKTEIKPFYELVCALEKLALENTVFTADHIDQLKIAQRDFEQTTSAIDRINADMRFHDLLTKGYANEPCQRMLSDLKVTIFFYEQQFMSEHGFYQESNEHHIQLIQAIQVNDLVEAFKLLTINWMQILAFKS